MGCGGSKKVEDGEEEEFKFEDTGVAPVDECFATAM